MKREAKLLIFDIFIPLEYKQLLKIQLQLITLTNEVD